MGQAQPKEKAGQQKPKMVGLTSAQKIFLFRVGRTRPIHMVWAESGPTHPHVNYFYRNVNNYCSHSACNQTAAEVVDERSKMGGNLAEEKEQLSLAWSGVGGGAGGRNGGGVGCLRRRKKEEENL